MEVPVAQFAVVSRQTMIFVPSPILVPENVGVVSLVTTGGAFIVGRVSAVKAFGVPAGPSELSACRAWAETEKLPSAGSITAVPQVQFPAPPVTVPGHAP